jgi:HAD superfamily hydrolase (TIGR01549 family)
MHKKAIFFDLYQTLLSVDAAEEKQNSRLAFETVIVPFLIEKDVAASDAALVMTHYADEMQSFYDAHDSKLHHHNYVDILTTVFKKYYKLILSESEMSELIYAFRKISRGYLDLYDGVPEVLAALSENYTLVVASYTQHAFTARELADLDILKYFTHCVYSSEIGFKKRANEFYQHCLKTVQLEPKDCVMVGDHLYEDMYMAHQNGLHTVWIVNPLTKDRAEATVKPDASLPIESIRELPHVIASIWNQ